MFTTQTGTLAAMELMNTQFDTGWIIGEQEDLSSSTLKKLMAITYVGPNQFKIEGLDATEIMQIGTKFRCKQGGEYLYLECVAISFSTDTTIAIRGDSLANAAITDFYYSNIYKPFGWTLNDGWEVMPALIFGSAPTMGPSFVGDYPTALADGDYTNCGIKYGHKFKCKQAYDIYAYIIGLSYDEPTGKTTFTFSLFGTAAGAAAALVDAAITDAYYSAANPVDFPSIIAYDVTTKTGFATNFDPVAVGNYTYHNGMCDVNYYCDISTGAGVSNAPSYRIPAPMPCANYAHECKVAGYGMDANNPLFDILPCATIQGGAYLIEAWKTMAGNSWTASGNKMIQFNLSFDAGPL